MPEIEAAIARHATPSQGSQGRCDLRSMVLAESVTSAAFPLHYDEDPGSRVCKVPRIGEDGPGHPANVHRVIPLNGNGLGLRWRLVVIVAYLPCSSPSDTLLGPVAECTTYYPFGEEDRCSTVRALPSSSC